MMKNAEVKSMHMSKSKREIIDTILKRQKDIASSFLKHKYAIHEEEDPEFLDEMSEVFDLRHWNVITFDPKSEANRKDKAAEDEIDSILKELNIGKVFYKDLLEDEVKGEMRKVLRMIYENEKSNQVLKEAIKKDHIIDQWIYLRNKIAFLDETQKTLWFRLDKRSSVALNAQTGCERAKSVCNQTQDKPLGKNETSHD